MQQMQSQMRGMNVGMGMGPMGGMGMMNRGGRGGESTLRAAAQRKVAGGNRQPATKTAGAAEESGPNDTAPADSGSGMMSQMMGGRMGGNSAGAAGEMMGGRMMGSPAAAGKLALHREVAEITAEMAIRDPNPRNKPIIRKLDEPISMSFNEETPLEDLLKYIRAATTTKTYSGIPIYVDPIALSDANVTMTSTVRNMDLDGIPLKTTLRLLLRQLGLAYCVRDGVLMISSYQGILDELSQARVVLEMEEAFGDGKKDPAKAPAGEPDENPKKVPGAKSE